MNGASFLKQSAAIAPKKEIIRRFLARTRYLFHLVFIRGLPLGPLRLTKRRVSSAPINAKPDAPETMTATVVFDSPCAGRGSITLQVA